MYRKAQVYVKNPDPSPADWALSKILDLVEQLKDDLVPNKEDLRHRHIKIEVCRLAAEPPDDFAMTLAMEIDNATILSDGNT